MPQVLALPHNLELAFTEPNSASSKSLCLPSLPRSAPLITSDMVQASLAVECDAMKASRSNRLK